MLPSFILRLLPRGMLYWCSDRARTRLVWLEERVGQAERLLEEVAPGYEYVEGFRLHLERKLDEWNTERFTLIRYISGIEDVLFPPTAP